MARKHAGQMAKASHRRRPPPAEPDAHRCGLVCETLRRGALPGPSQGSVEAAAAGWAEHRDELLARRLNPGWRHPGFWEFDELAERWRADPSWWERPDVDAAAARSTVELGAEVAPGITRRIVRRLGQLRFLAATGQLTPDEIEALIGRAARDPSPRAQAEARAIRDELQGRPRTP